MNTLKRLCRLDHPGLVLLSLLLSLWLAQVWLRAEQQLRPPALVRGSWRGQPPTILVRFNGTGGCQCGVPLSEGYKRCLERGVAFMVVASAPTRERYEIFPSDFPQARFFSEREARFALPLAQGKSETLLIVEGRIRKRWAGASITKGMLE